MTVNTIIDYAGTCFEFPTLSKVQGNPNYESLQKIKNELKANASTVPCDLGGEQMVTLASFSHQQSTPLCPQFHMSDQFTQAH